MRMRVFTAIVASLCLALLPSVSANAQTSSGGNGTSHRLQVACARIPNLITRTNNQLQKLPAGPDTKGSIAWVQAKAQAAKSNHMPVVAKTLTNHANLLTQKLAGLPNQLAVLKKAQTACTDAGYGS